MKIVLFALAMLAPPLGGGSNLSVTPDDPRIGAWDGKTASAPLVGPYEDRTQAEIPFGRRSFYLAPWRSYMDTWPASRLLQSSGINFNVDPKEADAVAEMMALAGVRSARVEVGWGSFRYDDPTKLTEDSAARLTTILAALKKRNIRPLILLNANSGGPCPMKNIRPKVVRRAEAGSRTIFLDAAAMESVIPGYTGFRGMADQVAFPLITAFDRSTGACTLSAPLPKAVPAGELDMAVLKYQPFSAPRFADGSVNKASQETVDGWKQYVGSLCYFVRDIVGDVVSNDSGFDVEVWNEYSFGSQFLDIANYYSPSPKFKDELTYSGYNRTRTGPEIILPLTIDFVNNPSSGLVAVGVLSGFSNQRPWDNGVEAWPGQMGFSRHYYTNLDLKPLNKQNDPSPTNGPVSALGQPDGKADGKDWNTVFPGTFFVPTLNVSMPERWHYGYVTEFITRDLQPFPGVMKNHFRFGAPDPGRPAQVWMTETNTWRKPWMDAVIAAAGCKRDDPRAVALSHAIGARAILRSLVFQSHKGVRTLDLFAAKEDDLGFAFLPSSFFAALSANHYVLTDKIKALGGPQFTVLNRLTTLFTVNRRLEKPVTIPRQLGVSSIVEYKPRLVFKGDGTAAHPDRYNRDDFACLPYQLSENKYAVGYYVVTRNMVHEWDPTKGRLDPARYTMPDQEFDLTLTNVCGIGATVSSYDPLSDKSSSVRIVKSSKISITARVIASDTPRFLIIHELKPGVVISAPHLQLLPGNKVSLSFQSNIPCQAIISWGALPERTSEKSDGIRISANAKVAIPLPTKSAQGVKIVLEFDGLRATWPVWDYDVQGKLPMAQPLPRAH